MDRNFFLAVVLSLGVLVLWSQWQGGATRPRVGSKAPPTVEETELGEATGQRIGSSQEMPLGEFPQLGEVRPGPDSPRPTPRILEPGETIRVETPLYEVELITRGAGIRRWSLKTYREGPGDDRRDILLTTGQPPFDTAMVTRFAELGRGDIASAPFRLVSNDGSEVVFELIRDGVTIRKSYNFDADSYSFRLRVDIENRSEETIAPRFGVIWPAHTRDGIDFREQALAVLHAGDIETELVGGFGTPGFLGSLSGSPPETEIVFPGEVDWAGFQTTYFIGAILPDQPAEASARFVAIDPGKLAVAEVAFRPVTLTPGQSATREFRGYVGPKEIDRLTAIGSGLARSVDLGWSWIAPMTRFFGWMLRALYSVIPNYGIAIIILTLLVKLVTAPLVTKQMRSMEGMRGLQPKIKELQAKHADDKQQQSAAMMSLYKKEGVNPLGGCLPMVLQLPVMIGLFYALRGSIELREAPFFGWITDLSAPETLFTIPGLGIPIRVLPLVMGATMVLQQRMTPQPTMDAAQARMMTTMMPIVMTVVFYQFASGLVLYWMLSNVLAIAHQLWIRRSLSSGPSPSSKQSPK